MGNCDPYSDSPEPMVVERHCPTRPIISRSIPKLSGNTDLTQCTDGRSLHRSPFAIDEPDDCRKQYAHRYSAHQDANDALQRP